MWMILLRRRSWRDVMRVRVFVARRGCSNCILATRFLLSIERVQTSVLAIYWQHFKYIEMTIFGNICICVCLCGKTWDLYVCISQLGLRAVVTFVVELIYQHVALTEKKNNFPNTYTIERWSAPLRINEYKQSICLFCLNTLCLARQLSGAYAVFLICIG